MPVKKAKIKKKKKGSIANRIQPVAELDDNLIMLVYGRADSGKTEFASTWPAPVLFLGFNEKGTATIKNKPDVDILELQDWSDFEEIYWHLKDGTDYKSIILDQITSLQGFGVDQIRKKTKKKPSDLFNKKDWGQLSGQMKTWMENYRNLSDQYNVCFLAHERTYNVSSNEEDEGVIDPYIGAAIMPSINTFTTGAVQAIGNTYVREEWEDDPKNKGEEIRKVEFCMRTGPSAYYFTKIRRPVDAGPVPEYIVNPTYQKVKKLMAGKSLSKSLRRK